MTDHSRSTGSSDSEAVGRAEETEFTSRLGIDIGGVITDRTNDKSDTSFFSDNFLETPACDGAFAAVHILVEKFGSANVFIVSKCGEAVERKTRVWLAHHGFFEATDVRLANVRFCRRRADKAPICRALGITHFIDDRADVLGFMGGVVTYRYLFGSREHPVVDDELIPVADWDELMEKIGISDWAEGSAKAGTQTDHSPR